MSAGTPLSRILFVAALSTALASPSFAAPPPGVTVVNNGDGTWSTPRVSTSNTVVRGALTFTYRGQDRYAFEPVAASHYAYTITDDPPERLPEQLLGRIHHDNNGERWEVTSVDESALSPARVASVDARIAAWTPDPTLEVGSVEVWTPASWTRKDCASPFGSKDTWVWNSESRSVKTAPFTDRQETAVIVHIAGGGQCSGTLLLNRWVLTAGHCVIDESGQSFGPPSQFTIENVFGEQVSGLFVEEDAGFSGASGDSGDDWALIKTSAAFPRFIHNMDLWDGSDSTYKDIDDHIHNLAFPGHTLTPSDSCDANSSTQLFHQSNAEVTTTTTKRVKLKGDAAKGASGSAFYFCPAGADDVCGPSEKGQIVGVFSGFLNSLDDRLVGPKATNFREEALECIEAVNN